MKAKWMLLANGPVEYILDGPDQFTTKGNAHDCLCVLVNHLNIIHGKRRQYPEEFERFWRAYPAHPERGKPVHKGTAYIAWNELLPEDYEQIPAHLQMMKETKWTEHGGKYIPKPENYLKAVAWRAALRQQSAPKEKDWY